MAAASSAGDVPAAPETSAAALREPTSLMERAERAFVREPPQFRIPRLDKPPPDSKVKKVGKKVAYVLGLLACNFFWACCCCRNLQMEVRGLLMLTSVETMAGFAYSGNLLATALNTDDEVDTSVYYIAVMLFVISANLWIFVLSSIKWRQRPEPAPPLAPRPHPPRASLRPRTARGPLTPLKRSQPLPTSAPFRASHPPQPTLPPPGPSA